MKPETKQLIRNTIKAYLQAEEKDRSNLIKYVEKNLKDHEDALNNIGMGYYEGTVQAGKIFLRIYKKL